MSPIFDFADSRARPVEWPTWLALAGLWAAFGLLTYFHANLPWWIVTVAGAYLVAFHGSLHLVRHADAQRQDRRFVRKVLELFLSRNQ